MPAIVEASKERVLLRDVSWEAYQCLLRDEEQNNGSRLIYDRGMLEIMSPLPRHEKRNRNLAQIVCILAEEWQIDIENLGSFTLNREDLARGLEPDTCFYIQNADQVIGREEIDMEAGDPPPDLAIEVDTTHSSLDKMSIYASLGVQEIWRESNGIVSISVLTEGTYLPKEFSCAFPRLSQAQLNVFFERARAERFLDWVSAVREWASTQ